MPKGFGSLTPERRREISSLGGKAAHAAGTAHRFSKAEAAAAGRIGGLKARKRGLAMEALAKAGETLLDATVKSDPPTFPGEESAPSDPPAGDPQAALDAVEIQRIHDEAMARS